jgi:hypothetical protein
MQSVGQFYWTHRCLLMFRSNLLIPSSRKALYVMCLNTEVYLSEGRNLPLLRSRMRKVRLTPCSLIENYFIRSWTHIIDEFRVHRWSNGHE